MQKVTNNVYVETGFAGSNNTFVTTSEGIVMIDTPQSPAEIAQWQAEMTGKGEVKYVINSEPHGDHVSGNWFFGGTVVAHEGVRKAIEGMDAGQFREQAKKMTPDNPLPDDFCFVPPAITYTDRMTLHVGDHTFILINMPGHTPYQTAVYIPEEKVVCTSDNVVYKTQPFMFQSVPFKWLESLKRYQELDVDIVVPGHGDVCDKAAFGEMAILVQAWVDAAKEAINLKMSVEQILEDPAILQKHGIQIGKGGMSKMIIGGSMPRLFEVLG